MPPFLKAPYSPPPSGRRHDRAWLRAFALQHPEQPRCALQPTDYITLWEAKQRWNAAAWSSSYRGCDRDGQCGTCPVLQRARTPTQLTANDSRVVVRIYQDGRPHLMSKGMDWESFGQPWFWEDLLNLQDWTIGEHFTDDLSTGFWLECSREHPDINALRQRGWVRP